MMTKIRRVSWAGWLCCGVAIANPGAAQAGPFLDWLFGRQVLVYPSPYGSPVQTAAPVPAATTAGYAPSTTVAGYHGVPVPATTVASQPVVVGYAPIYGAYPAYRTNWLRVPVTAYRTTLDYSGAYPVAVGQPCNTYTWQAQRIPVTVQRPWVPFTAAPTATNAYYAPTWPAGVPVAAPACVGCPTVAPAGSVVAPAPYGGAVAPAGAWSPPPAAATGVPGSVPMNSVPATSSPADQAPALSPGSYSPPASLGGVSSAAAVPINAAKVPGEVPRTGLGSGGAELNSPYRVTPIPAPDVRRFEEPRQESMPRIPAAPPLLPERDRSVSAPPVGVRSVEQASWQTPVLQAAASSTRSAGASPTNARPALRPIWNDQGWKSVREKH